MSADSAARQPKRAKPVAERDPARAPMFEVRHDPLPERPQLLRKAHDLFEDLPEVGQRSGLPPSARRAPLPPRAPRPLGRMLDDDLEPAPPRRPAPAFQRHYAERPAEVRRPRRAGYAHPLGYELSGRPWLLLLLIGSLSLVVLWFASVKPTTVISSFGGSMAELASDTLVQTFAHTNVEIPPGQHAVIGAPTLSAQFIDRVLEHYGSPARGTGAIWLRMGQQYGIDPAYALAFFIHESSAGTNPGWAGLKPDGSSTHNVGNIICAGYDTCFGRFRDYASWEAGIEDWYKLIANEYIGDRSVATVEQIIPIYAPSFENDVGNYVQTVIGLANDWRQGVVR